MSAALHVSAGCTGERHDSLSFLASFPPIGASRKCPSLESAIFGPDDFDDTSPEEAANTDREDDGPDVAQDDEDNDGARSRSFDYYTILCVRKDDLQARSILDAAPPGKLVFSLDRYSSDNIPKNVMRI